MLERIEFDEEHERSLTKATRWMFAAAMTDLVVGVLGLGPSAEEIVGSLAVVVVGGTLAVAAWAIRVMVKTDGRDQALLGRTLGSLRIALAVRLVSASLLAVYLIAMPFLFGGMALFTRLAR